MEASRRALVPALLLGACAADGEPSRDPVETGRDESGQTGSVGRSAPPPPPIPCVTRDDCDPAEIDDCAVDGSPPVTATCVRQAACFFGRCVWWNEDWPPPCPAEGCPNEPFKACLENVLANCDGCWHDTRCEDKEYCEELSGRPCSVAPSAEGGASQP